MSRHEFDIQDLLKKTIGEHEFNAQFSSFQMDLAKLDDYKNLKRHLNLKKDEQLLIYLAVPPTASTRIVDFLGEAGINSSNVKLMFEKPFGVDLASAKDMIERTARYFEEDQIYRIDHYLAKEMAQNIVVFRGSNAMFMHLWNGHAIEEIEVIATEQIGIENRVDFYEQTGALKDFVQGHLMQLLALTLMDIPHDFDWSTLPKLRLEALKRIRPADPKKAIRAQYDGYLDEINQSKSQTETFVQLELRSDYPRWEDVPIRLVTGKALDQKISEVRIHFRKFNEAQSNCLTFRIQPNEGIEIELFIKKPDYAKDIECRHIEFSYPADEKLPEAYEQVLVDAIESRKSLFASSAEIVQSWEILQEVQDCWHKDNSRLVIYPKGSTAEDVVRLSNN